MSKICASISGLCLLVACSSGSDSSVRDGGSGGTGTTPVAGGSSGSGGAVASGGSISGFGGAGSGSGGYSPGSGGTTVGPGTGGLMAQGGVGLTGTGGASPGLGGATTRDAAVGPDSSAGTGGRIGTGGAIGPDGAAGAGGKTSTGGTTGGNCTTAPEPSALIGWASQSGGGVSTTTGGGSAAATTVATLAALQAAVKGDTAAVVYVKGVLAAGAVSIGSNKTIIGLCGAEIHGHVGISGSSNVIVRNIKIVGYAVGNCALDPGYDSGTGCSSGDDAITVQNSAHHLWFDHCDISDGTDGNLDITKGADYVTVSWTKFHYTPRTDSSGSDSTGAAGHRYSNLVGGSDNTSGDVGKLNITWHHNWWADNVMERQPRVRYGKNHVLNNLYTAAGNNYCVRSGMDAQLLVEGNVFSGVNSPHVFNSTADQGTSYITAKNNVYTSVSGTQATGGGGTPFTTPPYAYTADATAGLQAAIEGGAGPH